MDDFDDDPADDDASLEKLLDSLDYKPEEEDSEDLNNAEGQSLSKDHEQNVEDDDMWGDLVRDVSNEPPVTCYEEGFEVKERYNLMTVVNRYDGVARHLSMKEYCAEKGYEFRVSPYLSNLDVSQRMSCLAAGKRVGRSVPVSRSQPSVDPRSRKLFKLPKSIPTLQELVRDYTVVPTVAELEYILKERRKLFGGEEFREGLHVALIYALGRENRLDEAKKLYQERLQACTDASITVAKAFLDAFDGKSDDAMEVLDSHWHQPGVKRTVPDLLISIFVEQGDFPAVKRVISRIAEDGFNFNFKRRIRDVTYVIGKTNDVEFARYFADRFKMTPSRESDLFCRMLFHLGGEELVREVMPEWDMTKLKRTGFCDWMKAYVATTPLRRIKNGIMSWVPEGAEASIELYNDRLEEMIGASTCQQHIGLQYCSMKQKAIEPNERTFMLLSEAFTTPRCTEFLLTLLADMRSKKFQLTREQYFSLLSQLVSKSNHRGVLATKLKMAEDGIKLTVKQYASLMRTALVVNNMKGFVDLLARMKRDGIRPSSEVIVVTMDACIKTGDLNIAKDFLEYEHSLFSRTSFAGELWEMDKSLEFHAERGDLVSILLALSSMDDKEMHTLMSPTTYEALVDAYVRNGGDLATMPKPESRNAASKRDLLIARNLFSCACYRQKSHFSKLRKWEGDGIVDGVLISFFIRMAFGTKIRRTLLENYAHFPDAHIICAAYLNSLRERGASGDKEMALEALAIDAVQKSKYQPDVLEAIIRVYRECRGTKGAHDAMELYQGAKEEGIEITPRTYVDMMSLVEDSLVDDMFELFRDTNKSLGAEPYVTYMVRAGADKQKVMSIFEVMMQDEVFPTHATFQALSNPTTGIEGSILSTFLDKVSVYTPGIDLNTLKRLYDEPHTARVLAMLRFLLRSTQITMAAKMLDEFVDGQDAPIADEGHAFTAFRFDLALRQGDRDRAAKYLSLIPDADESMYNQLLMAYGKANELDRVDGTFEEMKRRNVNPSIDTYNAVIGCHIVMRDSRRAIDFAGEALECGLQPNHVTQRLARAAVMIEGSAKDLQMLNKIAEMCAS